MNKATAQVLEFHKEFNQPIGDKIAFPDGERMNLRINLMIEELDEIREGVGKRDLPNVLKEFCDLQFVLLGSVIEFGMQDVFQYAFDEVFASNMSKSLPNHEEALKHAKSITIEKQIITKINEGKNGSFYITRLSDDKVLKPSSYMAANMDQFFDGGTKDDPTENYGNREFDNDYDGYNSGEGHGI